MNWTKISNYAAMSLVILLAIGAFVLSYVALLDVATKHGIPAHLAWIWPLLIDGSIVVFSIAVIRASLHQERSWWPWLLVGIFTVGTIAFNALHSNHIPIQADIISIVVFIVPPIASVLAFETAMAMLRNTATRSNLVQSIAEIKQEMQKKQVELDTLEQDRLGEIEAEGTRRRTEIETFLRIRQAELDTLSTQQATLQAEIDKFNQKLSDIQQQIDGKKQELNATQDATLVNIWDLVSHIDRTHLDAQTRQFFVALLTNAKIPQRDIAEWAGVTVKTVQRDAVACNGLIKK